MNRFFLLVFLLSIFNVYARKPVPASRFEQLTGKKISRTTKSMWDSIYSRSRFVYGKAPSSFLSQNYAFIPMGSKVLDVGMGEGRNSVFLAKRGYKVIGADISSVAIKKAQVLAKEFSVDLQTVTANLKEYEFDKGSFDAIICFYFVDRSLLKKLKKWLRPGGVIIYEGFSIKQRAVDKKPMEVEEYLQTAELLELFNDFQILKFEEPLHLEHYRSSIIAQKKST
jgi:SAM-dependent methyltransferase